LRTQKLKNSPPQKLKNSPPQKLKNSNINSNTHQLKNSKTQTKTQELTIRHTVAMSVVITTPSAKGSKVATMVHLALFVSL